MIEPFVEGAVMGLLATVNCAFMCMPVLFGIIIKSNQFGVSINRTLIILMIGRLFTYVFLGFVTGIIGNITIHFLYIKPFCFFVIAVLLAIWSISFLTGKITPSCVKQKKYSKIFNPCILGIAMGISPCPPFFAAIARAISIQDYRLSIIYFIGFFVASSFILLIPVLIKQKTRMPDTKILFAFVSMLFCFIFLFKSISHFVWMP
jgi:sulfite exporter TauE/SafE